MDDPVTRSGDLAHPSYTADLRRSTTLAAAAVRLASALLAVQVGIAVSVALELPWVAVLSLLLAAVLVASYVVTCRWLSRARHDVVALRGPAGHARSAGWTWWGWVVPVVSLWFPYQVVRDVQRESVIATGRRPAALRLWWTAWLVWGLAGQVAARLGAAAGTPLTSTAIEIVSAVALGVALWRWVVIVQTITVAQRELLARAGCT